MAENVTPARGDSTLSTSDDYSDLIARYGPTIRVVELPIVACDACAKSFAASEVIDLDLYRDAGTGAGIRAARGISDRVGSVYLCDACGARMWVADDLVEASAWMVEGKFRGLYPNSTRTALTVDLAALQEEKVAQKLMVKTTTTAAARALRAVLGWLER